MSDQGYLTGGFYQVYDNISSSGTPTNEHQWGVATGDQQFLGHSRLPQPQDHVQSAWLFFTDQPNAVGALKVVGGRQLFREGNNFRESFVWGNRAPFEQEIFTSLAYDNNISSWTTSRIMLYVTEADNKLIQGFRIVGAKQQSRDMESKRPYFTINEWGNTSAQEQFLGIGQSWSQAYDWGFSQVSVFLVPV